MDSSDNANTVHIRRELSLPGRKAIRFMDDEHNPNRPITLHSYRSEGYAPGRPVVIVQHGMLRNGDDYRDFWIPAADKHQLLIVAPTFSNEAWRDVDHYNNGSVFEPQDGTLRDANSWAYAIVGRIVDCLRSSGMMSDDKVYLFGHSAGGQFVHRLMSSQGHEWYKAAAPANAGWYSLPTFDHVFPEGMGGIGLSQDSLARLFAYPMMILAGDQDIVTDDPNLPSGPAALRQGKHRYARAHHYFEVGKQEAARLGVPFNWSLHTVPGIGHDGRAMSAACASLWFEGRLPSDHELAALAGKHVA
ncbi:alpha/beta hydrolase [Allopusillimonas ginsengisoli]|uniref:alpha/beta hydrolase n=1 Tax=Allopusillimonas ginsengisoli TaxID=453575 RepID=UPI00101FC25A|nr:alpha/beta hydrolase [Allopusillimonas ginsengisoli]TEA79159.1 alpha/beta hydrolase [Allopusillimonas ginsengisoli]